MKNILIVGNNIVKEETLRPTLIRELSYILFFLCFRYADHIIVVSKGLKDSIARHYSLPHDKIDVVYNGVEVERISKLSREPLSPSDKQLFKEGPILTSMGRLEKQKGYDYLIEAIATLKKTYPNIKLLIFGKGKQHNTLSSLIAKHQLQKNVFLLGFNAHNPYKYIHKSDLFISTSLYEGFNNSIVEALASGATVVSTDCEFGPRETLDSSHNDKKLSNRVYRATYGWLLPSPDSKSYDEYILAESLARILRSKKVHSRDRVKKFKLELMIKSYEKIVIKG